MTWFRSSMSWAFIGGVAPGYTLPYDSHPQSSEEKNPLRRYHAKEMKLTY